MASPSDIERIIPGVVELAGLLGVESLTTAQREMILLWERARPKWLQSLGYPVRTPVRWKLNDERDAITHHYDLGDSDSLDGYITMGMYPNGQLGEIFITSAKEGGYVSGMIDAFSTAISIGLQHGVPLSVFVKKFKHTRFGAAIGWGKSIHKDLANPSSVLDYIFKYLELSFPDGVFRGKLITVDPPVTQRESEDGNT